MNTNIADLIAAVKAAKGTVNLTVNVYSNQPVDDVPAVPALPDTDFKVGDRVCVCHIKKDDSGTKHTFGTVDAIQQKDDNGYYTRVTGDNGCHYRTGLKLDEERLGSKIFLIED